MTNSLSLSVSESFLQVGLGTRDSDQYHERVYFLPKSPIPKSIADFVNYHKMEAVQEVRLNLKSPLYLLRKGLGTAPAMLVTAGFEDWLNMNLPILTPEFRLQPKRQESPLDRDLIFGVNERLSPDGSALQPIDLSELEFLASKLKMSKVEDIAICFLHSNKNPQHLEAATNYFREQGFRVFPAEASDGDEKSTWWRAILSAYLQPFYSETSEELKGLIPGNPDFQLYTSAGLVPAPESFPLESLFAESDLLTRSTKNQVPKDSVLFYFGLEDFVKIKPHAKPNKKWNSFVGQVSATNMPCEWLPIQPTQVFDSNYWGAVELCAETVGFEPGPMCLGRGIRPTLLDLIYLTGSLSKAPVLADHLKKNTSRIKEAIVGLQEDPEREFSEREVLSNTLELCLRKLILHMDPNTVNYFAGPLASFFQERITKTESRLKVEVLDTVMTSGLRELSLAQLEETT